MIMVHNAAAHEKNLEAFAEAGRIPKTDVQQVLQTFQVAIHISSPLQPGSDEFVQAYVLCNILPRVFQRVGLIATGNASFPPLPNLERIIATPLPQPDITLVIGGPSDLLSVGPVLFLANNGWMAYLSRELQCNDEQTSPNPIAAYFAAALASGEVFKAAFGKNLEQCELCPSPYRFDMYHMREATGPVTEPDVATRHWDLGELLVVGVGAVGQAFLDAISFVPNLAGCIQLVDPDHSDESNEQRCVFAFPNNRGGLKVNIAYNWLKQRHPFVRVTRSQTLSYQMPIMGNVDHGTILTNHAVALSIRQDYGQFRETIASKITFPLVICAVDSAQTRRDIQFSLHKIILNGWTRTAFASLEYGIGRHTISNERACMACRYHPNPEEPTFQDFVARRTGWSHEKIEQYLTDDRLVVSAEEVRQMAAKRRIAAETLQGMVGRSLRAGLHEQCGAMQIMGSEQPAPVPHLGILTGALLAAATIRELNGDGNDLHLFQSDAQKVPNNYSTRTEPPHPNCLCRDPDVRAVYDARWRM
jgi:hypothetical protein